MSKSRIRIAITYIAYPVAMARYFHEALLRREDVQVWSACPYSGRSIPWTRTGEPPGMHLPDKYLLRPSKPLPMTSPPMVSYRMLEKELPWPVDLWIEFNAMMTAVGKPEGAPLAMVLTDPHVLGDFYKDQRSRADFIFNMQTPYLSEGDVWLPYAYSPQWHRQTRSLFANREYDSALIGLQYPWRTKLVERMRAEGLNVFYDIGPAYDDAEAIYHNTKVGFNWSSKQDTTARCFELMAFGIPAVMNRVPDLISMFKDGQDFLGFDTEEEALTLIKGLIADPKRAEEIGAAGRRAVEPHTWDVRIESILKHVGLI